MYVVKDEYDITWNYVSNLGGFKFVVSQPPSAAIVFCRYVLDLAHTYSTHMDHRSDYVEEFLRSLREKTVFAQDEVVKKYLDRAAEDPKSAWNGTSVMNYIQADRGADLSLTY